PSHMLDLRQRLAPAIGAAEDDLPFAGELIQVREGEAEWEGAIERLLHNFGLSLLVPDRLYRAVAEWVDRTHLRGRLVYFRVRKAGAREAGLQEAGLRGAGLRKATPGELHPRSLIHKLAILPGSAFYPWLEREVARRFDYACCDDLEHFRREVRA